MEYTYRIRGFVQMNFEALDFMTIEIVDIFVVFHLVDQKFGVVS